MGPSSMLVFVNQSLSFTITLSKQFYAYSVEELQTNLHLEVKG